MRREADACGRPCATSSRTLGAAMPSKQPLPRITGRQFIRSLPLDWIDRAIVLPGKTFPVAILIWHQAGLQSSMSVKLSMKALRKRGISRQAAYRALRRLEHLGLISVQRANGR